MTGPVSGSSLPQARDVHQHHHFHNNRDNHNHYHHHNTHHHARSPSSGGKFAHKRNNSEPTIIVETVSVLELIDSTGATVSVHTLTPEPTTATSSSPDTHTTVDTNAGTATAVDSSSVSLSVGISDHDGGSSTLSTPIPTIDPTLTLSESSMSPSFPTLSYTPLTSAPLSGSSGFPSLPGVTNTTTQASSTALSIDSSSIDSSSTSSNSTVSLLSFSSGASSTSSVSTSASSSSFFFSGSSTASPSTTSSSATSSYGSSSASASSTGTGGGIVGGVGGGGDAASSPSSTAADDGSDSSDGPTPATVAGSVLGGLAGLAFILILALGIIRWKKRQNTQKLMQGTASERGPSGTLVGNTSPSGDGSGGGGGGAMSERRRSVPFAIPSALANLTGYKRSSGHTQSSDGGERGFSKVSGRKLPPVIQFGGDGYSDPRATIMSEQSIEYRDSQMFLGTPASSRLAVGSPMRPESGVPVFNVGPARTPVTEQGPFPPPGDTSSLEPPPRDPLGRSHPSHDGSSRSHGSVSRFTEDFSHTT
ncbi:hypothetical protein F5B20DRAFT_175682 [Whalleya microplaca]|nr:hypothetical protein F5B20DRAFT_175682 [Whalleya microplaca]